ncbi:hypothetical protein Tco_0928443 [Tanacetum coccineum]
METENAQDEGRTREIVDEDKEIDEVRLSTEDEVSTVKEGVSTDFEKVSTDRPIVSTDESKVSTDRPIEGTEEQVKGTDDLKESTEEQREGTEEKVESTDGKIKGTEDQTEEEIATHTTQTSTQTPTSMIFGDDETIAKVLLNMSQAKAVLEKRRTKFKQLESDEELARKLQEESDGRLSSLLGPSEDERLIKRMNKRKELILSKSGKVIKEEKQRREYHEEDKYEEEY